MTTVDESRGVGTEQDEEEIDLAAPETRAAGRWHSAGVPTEKSKDFGTALRRLAALMRPERPVVAFVIVVAVTSAVCNVLGPRVLGHGTDLIVRGVLSHRGILIRQLHHGLPQAVFLSATSALL